MLVQSWTVELPFLSRRNSRSVKPLRPEFGTDLLATWNGEATINASSTAFAMDSQEQQQQRQAQIHRLPQVQRVHCISDLHVDNTENMQWLESKCRNATQWDENDLIVVAGDISHDMDRIEVSLKLLRETSAHVVFVPGNHEAWLSPAQKEQYDFDKSYSSLRKLEDIEKLCRKLNVYTTGDCVCVGGGIYGNEELWILPLDSWYDASLSFVDLDPRLGGSTNYELVKDFGKWPWVDFVQCRWPSNFYPLDSAKLLQKIPTNATDYFLQRNQPVIDAFRNATTTQSTAANKISLMTVTHFLPNSQSLPDWKDLDSADFDFRSWLDHGAGDMSAKFALVAGSDKIDAQIRSLGSTDTKSNMKQLHVFGHSHRPKDFVYKGIRYIHNPLGKPRERQMHMCDPEADIKLVWEANTVPNNDTIIRFWEERGGGLEMLRKRMETNRRNRKLFFQKRKLRRRRQQSEEQQ